jgi:hypothetical protein
MKVLQKLTQDPYAYIESVGREDKVNVAAALQDGGQNTVIRACLWRNR